MKGALLWMIGIPIPMNGSSCLPGMTAQCGALRPRSFILLYIFVF